MARFRVPASTIRAYSPRRRVFFRWLSPTRTMVRFSPKKLHHVGHRAHGGQVGVLLEEGVVALFAPRAITSFRATPTPARSLKG